MQSIREKAKQWLSYDEETRLQVQSMLDDPNEANLIDSFYQDLQFGTGGLRGIMGAGTNRINKYTIAKITQGIANYAKKKSEKNKIVIAYDVRLNNDIFSKIVAEVFAQNNFEVFLFANPRPTPLLSFAIRYLKCNFGIVLTASHNPPKYNGYKVYGQDGGQIVAPDDSLIIEEIQKVQQNISTENLTQQQKENIKIIHEEVEDFYLETLKKEYPFLSAQEKKIKIIYSALHGTGITLIPKILKECRFKNILLEPEQSKMDGNFTTVESPNPEEKKSLEQGVKLLQKEKADIFFATDPDADRIGLVSREKNGDIYYFNGNEIAALIFYYLLNFHEKELNQNLENFFFITTVVTSPLLKKMAAAFGVENFEVLTGFKYIAEIIEQQKNTELNKEVNKEFLFAAEESYGYLYKDFVRDKDAVSTSVVISSMAEYYKKKGLSLYDVLLQIYNQYGFHFDRLFSYTLEGKQGQEKINQAMLKIRQPEIIDEFAKKEIFIV